LFLDFDTPSILDDVFVVLGFDVFNAVEPFDARTCAID